ncbi:MAG: rod shape-determining protein MreC [Acidobacteriota bacterium]
MSLTDRAKDKAKKNPTWLFAALLLAHLLVISFNQVPNQPGLRYLQLVTTSGMMPFQWVATRTVGMVSGVWKGYFRLRDSGIENDRLKAERAQLETQMVELREKARLFDQFNALKDWQAINAYPGIVARVVGRDANQWFNTVTIDRGLLSGISKDQPVVTADGLVGRVILATPIASQVLLVTDERHGAGAAVIGQTTESRWLGIIEGRSQSLCEMRFIVSPEKLENGEQVVTSGQDGLYPAGLLIGRIKSNGTLAAPQLVEIEPAAHLGKLEVVKVLQVPPEKIHGPIDEVAKEEKEMQGKTSDRKKR